MKLNYIQTRPLKKITDSLFSIYIRLRDSDMQGNSFCISCGKPKYWLYADNGHYEVRSNGLLRYDSIIFPFVSNPALHKYSFGMN